MSDPYEPKNPNTQLYLIGRKIQEWSPLITVIVSAVALFVIGAQAIIYWKQANLMEKTLAEIRSGSEVAQKQANAAQTQASIAQTRVNIMADQTRAVKDSAQAAKDSAAAAQTQADTSKQLVKQNEQAVSAAISQSKSAQQSVGIAQRSFTLLERPSLGVEGISLTRFAVGQIVLVDVGLRNSGHVPARNATAISTAFFDPAGDISTPCPEPKQGEIVGLAAKTFYGVNGLKITRAVSRHPVSPRDFERVMNEKSFWLFIHVKVIYGESGRYFTEYYARYNADTKSWDECGTHNDAN